MPRSGLGGPRAACLLAVFAVSAAALRADDRFGAVGWTPDFPWVRYYNADWSYLPSPADSRRLYTLAKLDHRRDDVDWCREAAGPLCLVRSREAQRRLYDRVFERERAGMARIVAHHRTSPGGPAPDLHITIGNEPNLYPYVDPEVYAEVYHRYRRHLQAPAPEGLGCGNCRVLTGGILLFDPLPRSWLPLGGLRRLSGSLARAAGLGGDGEVTFQPWPDWTRRFLDRLHALGGSVDRFDVHVYPGEFSLPLLARWKSGTADLDGFLDLARSFRTREGAAAYPNPRIWIGEFGSLDPRREEAELLADMRALVAMFRRTPEVERWFWFKNTGREMRWPWAPEVGLYRDPRDISTRTALGRAYLELMRDQRFLIPDQARNRAAATKTDPAPSARR